MRGHELVVARGARAVRRQVLPAGLALHDRPRDRPRAARAGLRDRLAALGLEPAQLALGAPAAGRRAARGGEPGVAGARERRAARLERGGHLRGGVTLALGRLRSRRAGAGPAPRAGAPARRVCARASRTAAITSALRCWARRRKVARSTRFAKLVEPRTTATMSGARAHVARAQRLGEQRRGRASGVGAARARGRGRGAARPGAREPLLPGRRLGLQRASRRCSTATSRDGEPLEPAEPLGGRAGVLLGAAAGVDLAAAATRRRPRARAWGSRPTAGWAAAARRRAATRGGAGLGEDASRRPRSPPDGGPATVAAGVGAVLQARVADRADARDRAGAVWHRAGFAGPSCQGAASPAAPRRPTSRTRSRAGPGRRRRRRGPRR